MEDQNCIINYFSKYSSDKEILNNCFIFDVFSRKNYLKFWILKENTDFHFDGNNKAYFQHIMPFWIGDEIEINVSLFNNKGYLEIGVINQMYLEEGIRQINSFRWKSLYFKKIPNLQIFDTNDSYKIKNNTLYSYNTEMQDYDLSRICELELLKNIWFDLILRDKSNKTISIIKSVFEPIFSVKEILCDDVGYIIYKIIIVAKEEGEINSSNDKINNSILDDLGISIKVKAINCSITNELKKNFLVYDRKNKVECRVGDTIIFYFTK